MSTWRLTLEYDGRRFCGWQRQAAGVRTVQQTLEEALGVLFGVERVIIHGSGRTDSGVHALGQVASFRTEIIRDPERVRLGLNTLLPEDLSCTRASFAPDDFHARISAIGKTYRYEVLARGDRSPFLAGRVWHVRRSVDWAAVDAALAELVGYHEFSAFRGAGCTAVQTRRTIDRITRRCEDGRHCIEFEGRGFLRYQIRIMVGTAIEVGLGRRSIAQVQQALAVGERALAGRTAPPDGLYLVEVRYPEEG